MFCGDPKGGKSKREGISVYMQLIHFAVQQKLTQHGKSAILLYIYIYIYIFFFLKELIMVAQTVNNLPAMRETWVQSLGWEDPLEKGTATHSRILA